MHECSPERNAGTATPMRDALECPPSDAAHAEERAIVRAVLVSLAAFALGMGAGAALVLFLIHR